MDEATEQRLSSPLEDLSAQVARLEARVAALESRPAAAGARPARAGAAEPARGAAPAAGTAGTALAPGLLTLVGRTLLVLAGAYLVRALTDGHVLPAGPGVALGLAYAAVFQLLADREARAGRHGSAVFHDVASSLVAFPLVWEATARFGLVSPRAASAALLAFFALGVGVAWRRRLRANAVVTTLLALATASALLVSTHDLPAAMAALLGIAAGVEWLAWRGAWLGLRWAGAFVLDACAVLLVAVASRPEWPEGYAPMSVGAAEAALLAVPALYVASVAARTLRHGEAVTAFEVVQGTLAVAVGFGGAMRVLAAHGMPATGPGVLALLLGTLCYGAAFAFVERRAGQARTFYLYSTAGGLLALVGAALVASGGALAAAWAALGLLAAGLGRRHRRMTLRVHSAVFLAAAAAGSGLARGAAEAMAGVESVRLAPAAWGVAAVAAAAWAVLATDRAAPAGGPGRAPQLLLALVAVPALAAAVQWALWQALGSVLEADAGAATVGRTAVLAATALALAVAGTRTGLEELRWLVYPLVALGGVKLLTHDVRLGRPATLVVSLALYGLVLVVLPRVARPPRSPATGP